MNKDDIIRMAREAGIPETATEGVFIANSDDLGRLIAAECEACAQLLERTDLSGLKYEPDIQLLLAAILNAHLKAIRARGQS